MRTVAFLAIAVFGCVVAQGGNNGQINFDNLFRRYAGNDNLLQESEFERFWMHFDEDDDGVVSKKEFDDGWRREGFPHPQNAPAYFLELDRVPDEVLNIRDITHIFRLFDEDQSDSITEREMRYNWNAYFN